MEFFKQSGLISLTCLAALSDAALTTITNWGDNPTDIRLQAYIPTALAAKPAVVFAVSQNPIFVVLLFSVS